MIKFIRRVSDSEQIKRAVLRWIRTALNVILSNCTKTRTFSRYVYGDCILSLWRKSHFQRLEHKCFFANITTIFGLFLKNGHASQTFFRRPLKRYLAGSIRNQEVAYVLPMLRNRWHPHSGQIQISVFQTAFISSAIDRPVYLVRKRWYPWIVKINFRFLLLLRLFRNP